MWIILHLWMEISSISAFSQTQTLPYHAAFQLSAYCWPFALCTLFVGWGKRAGLLELASPQATLRHNPFYCLLFFPLTRLTIKSLQHMLTVCSILHTFCGFSGISFFSLLNVSLWTLYEIRVKVNACHVSHRYQRGPCGHVARGCDKTSIMGEREWEWAGEICRVVATNLAGIGRIASTLLNNKNLLKNEE